MPKMAKIPVGVGLSPAGKGAAAKYTGQVKIGDFQYLAVSLRHSDIDIVTMQGR